jgi:Protein of unknown function (DUF2934)
MSRISRKDNVVEVPQTDVSHSAPEVTRDAIARRAYEIYMGRGGADGHDLDDWLQAERELQGEPIRATS